MALTTFEKETIIRIHDEIYRRRRTGKNAPDQDKADLETIVSGTEAERQTLIGKYIKDIGIPECEKAITGCDVEKASVQAKLAEYQAYKP